jgi:putative membrane protein
MADWQQPQRQSAVGIFLFAAKAFREFIALSIIMIGSLSRKHKPVYVWLITFSSIAVLVFGRAFLEYFFFRFHISENQLIVKKGIFAKKTIIIPFDRIQSVQMEQNLFHRIIHHFRLSIDTAGTEKAEVTIHSLSYNKAVSLKQALTGENLVSHSEAETSSQIIHLSTGDLFKLAISHNHLETFVLVVTFALSRFNDIKDGFGIDAYDWMEKQGKHVAVTAQIIAAAIGFALFIAILISIVRIILKFSDLTITLTEKGFNLKHGLLHSHQQFIGANKIQYIQWNANWIRRKIGMYMFHVKTIGEEHIKNKRKIQVPITRKEYLQKLTSYYQLNIPSENNVALGIQPQYIFRKTLFGGLPLTVVIVWLFYFMIEWQALWFSLLLLYFIFRNSIFRKNFSFWVNDDAIEVCSGFWGRKRIVLNWHKLQVVTIKQGIYQRQKKLANLVLHTASGDVVLPYITLEQAQMLSDVAAMKAESVQKKWM